MINKEEILNTFFEYYNKFVECVNSKDDKAAAKKIREALGSATMAGMTVKIGRNGIVEFWGKESYICEVPFKETVVDLAFDHTTLISIAAKARVIRHVMVDEVFNSISGWGFKGAIINLNIEDEFPGYIQSLLPRLEEWLQTVSRDERDAIANDISDMLTYLAPEAKEFKQLNIKP